MDNAELIWILMGSVLFIYVITGGADYGAGVWYLFAYGKHRGAQRRAIYAALAPIWEANHIWLIFIVVLCFAAFPRAFGVIGTALHIPLTLVLIGIVLRGSAFVLHAYGLDPHHEQRWGTVFALSSIVTPIFLGMVFSALSSGEIRVQGDQVTSGYFSGWLNPFAIILGLFVLVIFALLAAVYLTVDAPREVREDFRQRALITQLLLLVMALITWGLAAGGAPIIWLALTQMPRMWIVLAIHGLMVICTLLALYGRAYFWARRFVVAQVGLVILGWGLGMRGYIVYPDVTLAKAGARNETLLSLNIGIPLGLALIVPSLWLLFKIFKGESD